jgi:hypothetical protein
MGTKKGKGALRAPPGAASGLRSGGPLRRPPSPLQRAAVLRPVKPPACGWSGTVLRTKGAHFGHAEVGV